MILLENLSKSYGKNLVLDHINVRIEPGKITGLLGPNGAGKTTLVSILAGIVKKDSGVVRVENKNIETHKKTIQKISGIVPQFFAFYPRLTTYENLEYFGALQGLKGKKLKERIAAAIAFASLETFLQKRTEHLSGGMKRRLNLAIALLNSPRILYLDEPTVGVDPQSRNYIMEMIKKLNIEDKVTIIYASHYMEEIEQIADTIVIIDHGKIILQDSMCAVLHNNSHICVALSGECANIEKIIREISGSDVVGNYAYLPKHDGYLNDLAKLVEMCSSNNLNITDIRFGNKNLEELFLNLTHKRLRD